MSRLKIFLFLLSLVCVSICHAEKRVLGKLGQTTVRASIYSSMSASSRVYYQAKPYEYLVLQETARKPWFRVLMSNGMYGYVHSASVAKLPYLVTTEVSRGSELVASRGASVARNALNYIGTPYVWGGNDPTSGIDCSGFVKNLYGQIGVHLPRTAAEQALVGQPVRDLKDLIPGDRLYFWEAKRGRIGHTGIYLGKGYFVHSSRGHNGVATDYLGSQKWLRILVAARR
jgi:hypothetical protein